MAAQSPTFFSFHRGHNGCFWVPGSHALPRPRPHGNILGLGAVLGTVGLVFVLVWFVLFLFVCFLLWEDAAALFDLSDGQGQVLNPPPSSPADLQNPPTVPPPATKELNAAEAGRVMR